MEMYPKLQSEIDRFSEYSPSKDRQEILMRLVEYILMKMSNEGKVSLNFICTHNSRRSQLAQVWAQTAADYFGLSVQSFSGGVEVTAFNERAVTALATSGFHVSRVRELNPVYSLLSGPKAKAILGFSKLYQDIHNPQVGFAAIMTCDHADDNCPFISGADLRLPLRYLDPKAFDDTDLEA